MSSEKNSAPDRGRSLTFRLNLWFAATTTVLALGLFFAAYWMLSSSAAQNDRELIQTELALAKSIYRGGGIEAVRQDFDKHLTNEGESFFVRIVGNRGAALFSSQAAGSSLPTSDVLSFPENSDSGWLRTSKSDGEDPWLVATARLGDGHWLQVGKTTFAHQFLLDRFRAVAGWVVALGLLLGLLAGALVSRSALRPVRDLIAAMRHVLATGDMGARVPVNKKPGDELRQLTVLFNAMLAKNDSLLGGMREALDNVAHDLRTPLTRLRSGAERTLSQPAGPGDREAVSDALEETESVLVLLDTLTDISEAETGLMRLDKTDVVLEDVVREAVDLYDMVAEDRAITVETEIPPGISALADRPRLRQALVNLLDNALKYTPGGGTVTIFANQEAGLTVLGVRDTGTGIPTAEIPRIWERLYRGDKSRSERGLGLGLALVRAIATAHGGEATVENAPGSGAVFSITFPDLPTNTPPKSNPKYDK